jgi:hypothetical protein
MNAPKSEFMRNNFGKYFGLAFFLLILATASVRAQPGNFEIQIPFDFIVKGQTMPAGVYSVGRLSAGNPAILIMKKAEGSEKIVFLTQSLIAGKFSSSGSTISFRRYGDRNFLYRIYAGTEDYVSELLPGKLELKLRRQMSAAKLITMNGKLPGK